MIFELATSVFFFAPSFSKGALHRLLGTLAAMTLHILSFDAIGPTLVGAGQRCLRTSSLMTTTTISTHDCLVSIPAITKFTPAWPKVTLISEMLIQIVAFHGAY